jgi:AcrR family transcriptional regulator
MLAAHCEHLRDRLLFALMLGPAAARREDVGMLAHIENEKPRGAPANATRRPYRSNVRAQAALDTRRNILDTPMRLFLERGYGMVTVADIAAEASLASPTVYGSTGGKAAILATLIDESMSDPIVDETLSAVRKRTSGDEVLRIAGHGVRVDNERYHDIVQVMKNATAVEAAAAGIFARSHAGYLNAMAEIARRLRTLKALQRGLTEDMATDVPVVLSRPRGTIVRRRPMTSRGQPPAGGTRHRRPRCVCGRQPRWHHRSIRKRGSAVMCRRNTAPFHAG